MLLVRGVWQGADRTVQALVTSAMCSEGIFRVRLFQFMHLQ